MMRKIYFDDLTGCYNRRFLHYWIENEIKRANRFATTFALLLLDIDDFRTINNNFGHIEGDRALIEFSEFLRKNIREVDNLVRYGGDEFIVLMPNTNEEGALEVAQRTIDSLQERTVANHTVRCSVGYSIFPDDGKSADALVSRADSLLYQAKKQGKNRIGMKQKVMRKLLIPSPVTIGRDDEVNWCLGQLEEYNTIFIAGEAGIGKTRLVYEIKELFDTQIILRGNAYAALSSVPYHPFKNMFSELINKDFVLVQRIFKQIPEIYQSEIMKIVPAEGIMKVSPAEGLDKFRLYNAVSEFMLVLANFLLPTVTILFMDDLHWLDQSSCELLDFVIRSIKKNIKIFGTYRVEEIKNANIAEYLGMWAREKLYTRITLSPLNEKQTTQLLEAIMGSTPQVAAKYIFQQSGGNPFYVEELLRELQHQKKMSWNGREWIFTRNFEVTIPSSVEETIKRKLKFLDPEMHDFLKIAAVFGHEFTADVIATASRRNVGQILDALDELHQLGFIKENAPDNYFFSEDIVRQIVYKNISRRELLQYHKAVGEAIEIIYRNVLTNYYEQLATHFSDANEAHKALFYSKKAALKAKDNYAHAVAIKFFENALKFEDDIEEIFKIKFSLAEIYYLIGEYNHAIQHFQVCLKIDPNSYRVYEKLGKVHETIGDYKKSLQYYRIGLAMTQGTDAVYTFRTSIAWLYTRLGQYARAQNECEDMLRKKAQMNRQSLGDAYIILGVVYLRLGKFKKAELCFKKGLRIRETMGDKKRIAACYLDLGLSYYQKFNVKLSEKFLNKALKMYEEIGSQEDILLAYNNIGALYADYDLPKAEEYYLKALKQAKLIGAKRTFIFLYNNLGGINYSRLMDDQAFNNFREALKYAKEIQFPEGVIFSNIMLSEFYRDKGKAKKGRIHLNTASRVARQLNIKYLAIDCMHEEIEYLLRSQQLKKADALSKKILSQLKMERSAMYKMYSLIYRGRVLTELKQYAQAHTYFNKAYKYIRQLPNNRIVGEIQYWRGIAYKKEKRFKDSLKMFLEAHKIFAAIGNLRYLDKIESEITETSM